MSNPNAGGLTTPLKKNQERYAKYQEIEKKKIVEKVTKIVFTLH